MARDMSVLFEKSYNCLWLSINVQCSCAMVLRVTDPRWCRVFLSTNYQHNEVAKKEF